MARVLLVDDDLELLDALSLWLSTRGHDVRAVSDARTAAAESRAFRPDVVLLDGILAGTTGTRVADEIRAAGHGRIVFCSALPPSDLPEGMPVLGKPLELDRLEATIAGLAGEA